MVGLFVFSLKNSSVKKNFQAVYVDTMKRLFYIPILLLLLLLLLLFKPVKMNIPGFQYKES
jgi:hypothetical protein